MSNHIFNKKKLLLASVLIFSAIYPCYADSDGNSATYPVTIENSSETFFVPAQRNVEEPAKKSFFNFSKKEKLEKAPISDGDVIFKKNLEENEAVADEAVNTEEKPNKFKELINKIKPQDEVSEPEAEIEKFNEIQKKIEEEKLFKHDTVNRVYLDRFKPVIEENLQTYYDNRKIEVGENGLEVVIEDGQKSIIDLINEIEQTNPDSAFTPPVNLTLRDCVGIAMIKNPAITSAFLNTDIYKSRIVQAWAAYFPDFSLGVDYSHMHSKLPDYKYTQRAAYFPNFSAGLLLFDFGKTKTNVDIAKADYTGSKYDLQDSINEIIYAVKSAYYNLVFAQKQIDIYKTTIEEFELQLKAAQKYFAIGKKPQIDVVIAEYNVGSAKLNLVKALNTYEVAKVNLANTIGLPEFANFALTEELSKFNCEEELETFLQDAFSIRPDLLSFEKTVESNLLNVRRAKRDFAPDLRANGSIYRGGVDPYKETNYNLGVNLSYSGMNLLQLKKEYEIALKSYEKSLTDYDNKRQSVYLEVKQAYIDMMSSKETVKQAELNVDQAKAQHYHAAGRYNAGLGDAIELKDSENTYMNAQLEYFQALLDYNANIANLERVIGRPIENTQVVL